MGFGVSMVQTFRNPQSMGIYANIIALTVVPLSLAARHYDRCRKGHPLVGLVHCVLSLAQICVLLLAAILAGVVEAPFDIDQPTANPLWAKATSWASVHTRIMLILLAGQLCLTAISF